jgi:biotin-(acetyl-CoA carboxylase) ligase
MRLSTPELFETWKSRLETIGQYVTVGGVSGMVVSVDRDGALLVCNSDDQVHRVLAGDVALGQR